MINPRIKNILCTRYPEELVDTLIQAYSEVLSNYRIEKWKPSELDAGHFVETARRFLEHELTGNHTALNRSLNSFNQTVLNRLESSSGDESFRILIPRTLYAIYCIRNKRGVGHISSISPNKLDATFILNSVKWVLSEFVRISASSTPDEADEIINSILERQVNLIWDDGESYMILDKRLNAEKKILISLYKKDRLKIKNLQSLIDYKNNTHFKKIALKLKANKYIDITQDGTCKLSPLGIKEAEQLINVT